VLPKAYTAKLWLTEIKGVQISQVDRDQKHWKNHAWCTKKETCGISSCSAVVVWLRRHLPGTTALKLMHMCIHLLEVHWCLLPVTQAMTVSFDQQRRIGIKARSVWRSAEEEKVWNLFLRELCVLVVVADEFYCRMQWTLEVGCCCIWNAATASLMHACMQWWNGD
jgi:hypothetical protein